MATADTISIAEHFPPLNKRLSFLKGLQLALSLRGWILLAFISFLLLFPVRQEKDVVAAVFALSMCAILLFVTVVTIIQGFVLRRSLHLQLSGMDSKVKPQSEQVASGREHLLVLRTSRVGILPFFSLRLEIEFENKGVKTAVCEIAGSRKEERSLVQKIVFSHRGVWRVRQVRASFGDQSGFSVFRWNLRGEEICRALTVDPPEVFETHYPVLSSCQRSGDLAPDPLERRGEPYDLKRYDPSDGIKKIVWKIFARRGELVARHGEPSMTPEGKVIVFGLARPQDDPMCGAMLAYLHELEDYELEVFFGCQGMGDSTLAQSANWARTLLIESVWNSRLSTPETILRDLESVLVQAKNLIKDGEIQKILIFVDEHRFATQADVKVCTDLGTALEQKGMQPVFLIHKSGTSSNSLTGSSRDRHSNVLEGWFLHKSPSQVATSHSELNSLLDVCAKQRWEVIL